MNNILNVDNPIKYILLGNQGEKEAIQIQFDMAAWQEFCPTGATKIAEIPGGSDGIWITYIRPNETDIWIELPRTMKLDSNVLTWTPSHSVMAKAGQGTVVLHCTEDGKEKRSVMATTIVASNHKIPTEAPEPLGDYISILGGAVTAALNAADKANEAVDAIHNAPDAKAAGVKGLPVILIEADSMENWIDKKDERLAKISFRSKDTSFDGFIKIKPQGTSSLLFPKKNFTITFYADETYAAKKKVVVREDWGAQSKYVMKADWIDATHAGNVVTAQLAGDISKDYGIFPEAPNAGCIDGFPTTVYGNGKFLGLYNFNIPKDGWMAKFDGNEQAMILAAETQDRSCAFRELADFVEWESEYGDDDEEALSAFNRMVAFVKDSSDAQFKADFEQYLNLDAALNYYCISYFAGGIDNLGKNMLMMTEDRLIWYPILYDLDSLWGVNFTGKGFIEHDILCPEWYECSTSLLWEKLERNFGAELAARYNVLRETHLNCASLANRFSEYIMGIDERLYAKELVRWTEMNEMVRSLDGMIDWIHKRAKFVDFAMNKWQTEPSASLGTKLLDMSWSTVGDDNVHNTGIKLYDTKEKEWTLLLRMPNTNLTSGYRTVLSCENNSNGLFVKRESTSNNELFVRVGNGQVARLPHSNLPESVIAIVKSDGAYQIYRDGVMHMHIKNRAYTPSLWKGPLYLGGGGNETGTETWHGNTPMTLSNVVVHNKALNAADIVGYTFK